MKKILYSLLAALIGIGAFLTGFWIRQPRVNKLKKQVDTLQKDNNRLISLCESKQNEYRELLVQHKALKALQFRKKAALQDKMTESISMQYAIIEYVSLLIKRVKHGQELSKEEVMFFNAFEKVIDGKANSTNDKVKILNYVKAQHGTEIKQLKECEFTPMFIELRANTEQELA